MIQLPIERPWCQSQGIRAHQIEQRRLNCHTTASRRPGVVRGLVVRSRNIFATLGATLQTVVGGNITVWTKLCEDTRADAFDIMIQHATEIGANAIVGARYDTTELSTGVTEVLAYGTAVIVEPANPGEGYR